jgi:predicted DsbA family dithiol-disulfide isomerase
MSSPILIDVHSDAVCPWCYLGKRRLERALVERPAIPVEVRWRAFELNPGLAVTGVDRAAYLEQKFGAGQLAAAHERLVELGRLEGIPFRFDAIARMPNTRLSHVLVAGSGARAGTLVEALFAAYFERGEDIGDPEVLVAIAATAGVDPAAARERLASREAANAVAVEEEEGRRLGIQGVPFFVFAGRWALSGAQEPAQFVAALDEVHATLLREQAARPST